MSNVTKQFSLSDADHGELLYFFGLRFGTPWRVSSTDVDFPGEKNFALRVKHDHGRIKEICTGPAMKKKRDLAALLQEIKANLRDPTIKEYGRGTLTAGRPVRGGVIVTSR